MARRNVRLAACEVAKSPSLECVPALGGCPQPFPRLEPSVHSPSTRYPTVMHNILWFLHAGTQYMAGEARVSRQTFSRAAAAERTEGFASRCSHCCRGTVRAPGSRGPGPLRAVLCGGVDLELDVHAVRHLEGAHHGRVGLDAPVR